MLSALRCGELLAESPSTSALPQQRRKQPFAVLPNNIIRTTPNAAAKMAAQKRRMVEDRLNHSQKPFVPVDLDRTVHLDVRSLGALLCSERRDDACYFDLKRMISVQQNEDFIHYWGDIVEWMCDVCTEEKCDFSVFPLAVGYLNRILSLRRFSVDCFQSFAAACLFIASKMKAPQPITAAQMCQYSKGAFDINGLLDYEMAVVNILGWDVSVHTMFEFFDQLLVRAPGLESLRDEFRSVGYTLQKDCSLSRIPPSHQTALIVNLLTLHSPKKEIYRRLLSETLCLDLRSLKKPLLRLQHLLNDRSSFVLSNQLEDSDEPVSKKRRVLCTQNSALSIFAS